MKNARFVLVVAVLCSACAGTMPAQPTTTRAERAALRDAREAQLIELAKRHPTAVPRERSVCPEKAPPGGTLNCPPRAASAKPWL